MAVAKRQVLSAPGNALLGCHAGEIISTRAVLTGTGFSDCPYRLRSDCIKVWQEYHLLYFVKSDYGGHSRSPASRATRPSGPVAPGCCFVTEGRTQA